MIALPRLPLSVWLAAALAVSLGVTIILARQLAAAEAECTARIADLSAQAQAAADRAESLALRIARETAERAEAEAADIRSETVRYVERVREIRIPVPAECHAAMPNGVQDALADAARAANRGL